MTSKELIRKHREFFEKRGHAYLPSASLIPENDPTVLFTTAGMHPLVPYLLGEPHPQGRRLANYQKCLRTVDIEEVGDPSHLTLFEMLGNWSLGDYWKGQAIEWSWEFTTDPKWLGIAPERLYATVFAGDEDAPRDEESIQAWRRVFQGKNIEAEVADPAEGVGVGRRIFLYGKEENWWGPAGETGPCGPDSELFYDLLANPDSDEHLSGSNLVDPCHPNCPCGRFVEIGNDVFMEYNKLSDGSYELLDQKNVDNGRGFERLAMVLQGVETVYGTDLFTPIMERVRELAAKDDERSVRVITDHLRAATFLIADGVEPSNVDQGYVLRRLVRRALRHARVLGIEHHFCSKVSEVVAGVYAERYPELGTQAGQIAEVLSREEQKFRRTLDIGLRLLERDFFRFFEDDVERKLELKGDQIFHWYQEYGFPPELTVEVAAERGIAVAPRWRSEFDGAQRKHQQLSRAGAEQKFAGGLSDHTVETTRLHTATHLLLEALRRVLGSHVEQRGSNITRERLRLDFSHSRAMTGDEIAAVERMVNEQIRANHHVTFEEMPVEQARAIGATGIFGERYGERVKVYFIGDSEKREYFSKEICGGPHVTHTGELGTFKILKGESPGSGIRRIRAILE